VRTNGSFVGGKKMIIEVVPKGMKMDLAATRVNASEGFLQSVVIVCAAVEVLRSFAKLSRALEMRSSFLRCRRVTAWRGRIV
jgi:hypothetical protein